MSNLKTEANEDGRSPALAVSTGSGAFLREEADHYENLMAQFGCEPTQDPEQVAHLAKLKAAADDLQRMAASLAAIHWNAGRADADRATLLAIRDECEHAIPELANIRARFEGRSVGATFESTQRMADEARRYYVPPHRCQAGKPNGADRPRPRDKSL